MPQNPNHWVNKFVTEVFIHASSIRHRPVEKHDNVDLLSRDQGSQLMTGMPLLVARLRTKGFVPLEDKKSRQTQYLKNFFGSLDMLEIFDDEDTKASTHECLMLLMWYLREAKDARNKLMALLLLNQELLIRMIKWQIVLHEQRVHARREPELFAMYDLVGRSAVGPFVFESVLNFLVSQSR